MPTIQIKNVSKETHAVLRARAAAAHQSLQEYLLTHLEEEARRPTLDEILDRAAARAEDPAGGHFSMDDVVTMLREDRARH